MVLTRLAPIGNNQPYQAQGLDLTKGLKCLHLPAPVATLSLFCLLAFTLPTLLIHALLIVMIAVYLLKPVF
jgi:hypothetical protein